VQEVDAQDEVELPSVAVTYKLNSKLNQPKVELSTLPGGASTISATLDPVSSYQNATEGAKLIIDFAI
jgi:hypothetical protein